MSERRKQYPFDIIEPNGKTIGIATIHSNL